MRRLLPLGAAVLSLSLLWSGCSTVGDSSSTSSSDPATSTTAAATTSEAGTTTAAPTTTVPSPTVEEVVASLSGLPFDEFVDASFGTLLLRSPQSLTESGLAAHFGVRRDRLDDRSDAFLHETMALQAAILDLLHTYDRAALGPDEQVAYDVYEWTLDDLVRGHPFVYHDYPLNSFLYSYHQTTVDFFTDLFPLESPSDAEDYVTCVGQIRRQASQVLEGLRIREDLGIYPPDFDIIKTRVAMLRQLGTRVPDASAVIPTTLAIYTSFEERTLGIAGLSDAARTALLAELESRIAESFVPAWIELIDYLDHLEEIATSDAGVWKLPDGEAYYAYLLRSETSTELSAQEIHEIGLAEVARIQGEMRAIFVDLGYSPDASWLSLLVQAYRQGGVLYPGTAGARVVPAAYREIIAGIYERIDPVFGLLPEGRVEVVGETWFSGGGGYYVPPSFDGTRPGAFHCGAGPGEAPKYRMKTIAYHETVPGHHLQLALAQELDLSLMQKVASFNGYAEGWALYAERLAKELGMYEDDPYGDLGRLHMELMRAVRLVTDTGIHALGWTREEAKAYVNEAMGEGGGQSDTEVDRYIDLPAQATGYMIGLLRLLDLRSRAEEALGEGFDLAAFHDVVLGHGAVPLEVLERLVDDWIASAGTG